MDKMPRLHVACDEVIIIDDDASLCLEIELGTIRIIVFGTDVMPTVKYERGT